MIIAKELFDECFCSCEDIGRVCINGFKIKPGENFPKNLVEEMMKRDGEEYTPSCFCVEVFDKGAALYYTTFNGDFIELGVVDNDDELRKYYLENASEDDIKETGWR